MQRKISRIDLLRKSTMNGDYELAKFCLEHSDINLKDNSVYIEHSGYNGYYDITKLLLEHGANPNGYGQLLSITKVRDHYKTYHLLNTYIRKKKLNKILNKIR